MVDSSGACATVLAGIIGTGVAGIGARVVVGEEIGISDPCGVVCHGTKVVSAAEKEILKTRDLELGGNGAGELIFVQVPD